MKKLTFLALTLAVVMTTGNLVAVAETINPLAGKIIALDAGHGNIDTYTTGAVNQKYGVAEADVNLSVVNALKLKLEGQGAYVVVATRFSTRKDRVNDAIAKCAALDLDSVVGPDNRKCDVLVSVHHNGITDDPTHDGTLVIYNEKQDIPLATALHNSLIAGFGLTDEGYLNGGYGITVYGHLVSALTEGYYITNDCEAELYLYSIGDSRITDLSQSCKDNSYTLENRIDHEAQLQVNGLSNYFASQTGGKGRNK